VIGIESRVLNEGYGPGAWHGADLKAAIADVTPALAFWRPAEGRHGFLVGDDVQISLSIQAIAQ
jgi:hypothetical protein